MNHEDIIHMAVKAGCWKTNAGQLIKDDISLTQFAALVAAAEREACAKVCEARYMGDNNREDMEAWRCAAAIRARGQA